MARKQKPEFYAVARGRRVGIFRSWPECEAQVKGSSGAKYKGFKTLAEAEQYMKTSNAGDFYRPIEVAKDQLSKQKEGTADSVEEEEEEEEEEIESEANSSSILSLGKRRADDNGDFAVQSKGKKSRVLAVPLLKPDMEPKTGLDVVKSDKQRTIEVYTDGAASSNGRSQARAGWGVYWPDSQDPKSDLYNLNESKRLPGSLQTNNRAELMAIVRAIQLCPDPEAQLIIYTDSQYCIKAINDWQRNWRKNNWLTSKKEPVLNKDLIRLLEKELRGRSLRPTLIYVKGHSSSFGNEQADRLAVEGAQQAAIPESLWQDVEPPASDEESNEQQQQKAIEWWQKRGFTLEEAKRRAES